MISCNALGFPFARIDCWISYVLLLFSGSFCSRGGLLEGYPILGWGPPPPSLVGRRGASQASPNTTAGRRGGPSFGSHPASPHAGTIRVAQAKCSGAAARKIFEMRYGHIWFRW